jgi:hypothetical protein
MPKKKKAVFTAAEEAEVKRISTEVIEDFVRGFEFAMNRNPLRDPPPPAKPENNYVVISKAFRGANAEQMELDINDWLKTTGAQEIHKIDSLKDPLSSMGVIKTVFVKVKAVPTVTLGASADAASTPESH